MELTEILNKLTMNMFLHSLPGPPSPSHPIRLANVLHNMTGTLSDCIYQSLTGMTQEKSALGGSKTSHRKSSLGPTTGTKLQPLRFT